MKLVDGAVFFEEYGVLCIADLHLGYEAELRYKGHHIPTSETAVLFRRISRILAQTNPHIVVLNGDVKHTFGKIHDSDWRELRELLDILGDREVVIVAGNHDTLLKPLADKNGVQIVPSYVVKDTLFMHGDELPEQLPKEISRIVIGHEHPAIGITSGPRTEVVKCYLMGTYKDKELLVLPSMFSLTEGTDILKDKLQSPFFAKNLDSFRVYALSEGEILDFGTVADVKRLR